MNTIVLSEGQRLASSQLPRQGVLPASIMESAQAIIAEVQQRKDDALRDFCLKFDGVVPESFSVDSDAMDKALAEVEKAAELAKQSGEALQGIVTKVEESADQVSAIATASEQQSATSDENNQSIVSVNEMSSQTAQAMGEASRAVSELARQAERMSELISEMKRG